MPSFIKSLSHVLKVGGALSKGIGPSTNASQERVRGFAAKHREAVFDAGVTFTNFADRALRTPGKKTARAFERVKPNTGKALMKAIPRGAKSVIGAFEPSTVSYHVSNLAYRFRGGPSKKSEQKLQQMIQENRRLGAERRAEAARKKMFETE